MTQNVIRLTNSRALAMPEVNDLFKRAFDGKWAETPWSAEVSQEMIGWIENESNAFWIGEENGKLKALLILLLPQGRILPLPMVYLVYNRGSRALLAHIVNIGVDFLKAAGYSRFAAINRGAPDPVFMRHFKRIGKLDRIGSIMEFNL